MGWNWFDYAWSWLGLLPAAVLLAILFATDRLRSDPRQSPWTDPVWLGWLVVPVYMIHQFEEYGVNLLGEPHGFPNEMCALFGMAYPACPIPAPFYVAVNVPLIWIAAPLAALLARRLPLVGLGFYGLLLANGTTHIIGSLLDGRYGSGLLTSALLFLPLAAWVGHACFGKGRLRRRDALVAVLSGLLIQSILIASVQSFLHGRIGSHLLVAIQIINAFVLPALTALWSVAMSTRKN